MNDASLPTFSIVIPTHNRPKQLAECLRSLTRVDYPHGRFDVIVVDDGCSQPLDDVVAPFDDHLSIELVRQEPSGPAKARNTGVAHATGRFLALLDDDCEPAPDWLNQLAARLDHAPKALVGGDTINALEDNVYSTASQLLISYLYDYFNRDPQSAQFFTANNMALAVEAYKSCGGFDASLPLCAAEDREFCHRWLGLGRQMIHAPQVIIYHSHPMSLREFWRQHFTYGRGAFLFHRVRAKRGGDSPQILPLRFYINLLLYPLRQTRFFRSLWIVALLIITQVATIAGYFGQRRRPSAAKPST